METITVYENNDPRQAKTFRGQTQESALGHLSRWMIDRTPDICLSFTSRDPEFQSPVWSLAYCESYKDFEIRYTLDDDPEQFDHYIDAVNRFVQIAKEYTAGQ